MPTIEVRPDSEELLQQVAESVLRSKKIIVVTGAGISTNSGIPDFRSENGLYSLIQAQFDAASKLAAAQRVDDDADSPYESSPPPAKRRRTAYGDRKDAAGAEDRLPTATSTGQPEDKATNNDSPATTAISAAACTTARLEPGLGEITTIPEARITTPVRLPRADWLGSLERGLSCVCVVRGAGSGNEPCCQYSAAFRADIPGPKRRRQSFEDHCLSDVSMIVRGPNLHRRARSLSPPRPRQDISQRRFARLDSTTISESPSISELKSAMEPCPVLFPPTSSRSDSRPSPMSVRFKASLRTPSRFATRSFGLNSSPLSSPPPVLFDPFVEPSSSTSHQGSSDIGSATSSETDQTPPSSAPSLASQTSNPTRTSLPNLKGRDLFDASIWSDPVRTSVFYTFTTTLRQKARDVEPTTSHRFISHLKERGKLVRCYTQNIDQIEEKVGLSTSLQQGPGSRGRFSRKSTGGFSALADGADSEAAAARETEKRNGGVECVFLHGSLQSLRCFLCGQVCEWDEGGRSLETLSGRQPECPHCVGATTARQERGKRALGVGKLRPDIVLYGEEHPNAHLIDPLVKHDLGLYPDFLLILGTSLKVHGLKVIVREFARTVHCKGGKVVFVNYTKPPESSWGDIIDYWIQWDCDAWVTNLQERVPLLWLPPGTKLPSAKRKRESSGQDKTSKRSSMIKQESSLVGMERSQDSERLPPIDMQHSEDTAMKNNQQVPEQEADEVATSVKPEQVFKPASRPMSTREDKINGAHLTWQISRDLRRLSGNAAELQLFSSPRRKFPPAQTSAPVACTPHGPAQQVRSAHLRPRKSLPPARHITLRERDATKAPRKSLPTMFSDPSEPTTPKPQPKKPRAGRGWVYVSEDDPEARAVHLKQQMHAVMAMDHTGLEDQSILSAVKSNPRLRKRKVIDGVEVGLSANAQRPPMAKTPAKTPAAHICKPLLPATKGLPRPPLKSKAPPKSVQDKENNGGLSPNIISDLNRVTMHNLTLAPIRVPSQPFKVANGSPTKLTALEPLSPPAGPLARIATNVSTHMQPHPYGDMAFKYCDLLKNHFTAPLWTPDDQLRQEQAAVALNGLRSGKR